MIVWVFWFARQYFRPGNEHFRQGQADAAAGRYAEAQREWQQGIREDPNSPPCYIALGDLAFRAQQYPQAAQAYAAAAHLLPNDGHLALKVAHVDEQMGNSDGAYDAAQQAVRLLPDDPEALAEYGFQADQKQYYPVALASLRRAVQKQPGNAKFLVALVYAEEDSYDLPGAEADLMPYLQAHPNDQKACFLAAALYSEKPATPSDITAGMDFARRALAAGFTGARIHGILGRFYLARNQLAPARQEYQTALRLSPNNVDALHGLLDCDTRLGDRVIAAQDARRLQITSARHVRIEHLQIVCRRDPADTDAALQLAGLEEQDGSVDLAQRMLADLVRQSPDGPRVRPALAAFYRRQGRPDLARQALQPQFIP